MSRVGRVGMIDREHPKLSLVRQCALLGLSRSSLYYRPKGVDEGDLSLMSLMDRQYLKTPFYGSRRMTAWLRKQGWQVDRKRVRRLMKLMGITAVYQPPNTSKPWRKHKVYPYLLRGMVVNRVNQAWCADITYIPMAHGFMYLVAIMDWRSRYVLAWRLSNSMDSDFCVDALEEALSKGRPEIFNTDQGSQFTSEAFTGLLLNAGIQISMDGKGRCSDNVFVERLWRSLKYEEVYLKGYQTVREARDGIGSYFHFYNAERPHQALEYRTPGEVFAGGEELTGPLTEAAEPAAAGVLVQDALGPWPPQPGTDSTPCPWALKSGGFGLVRLRRPRPCPPGGRGMSWALGVEAGFDVGPGEEEAPPKGSGVV